MTNGIIYIATGEAHTAEALVSAASARRHMPHILMTLFTDLELSSDLFEQIIRIASPNYGLRDKVTFMKQSPYERTLFLDTDTFICADIQEMFTMLDRFDIAAVHEGGHQGYPILELPDAFPEYNSGVIVYRRTDEVIQLFTDWLTQYDSEDWTVRGRHLDQPAFRKCLYQSTLAIGTLSSQYNCRFLDGGRVGNKVKILHRRTPYDFEKVEQVLNDYDGLRVCIGDSVYRKRVTGGLLQRIVVEKVGSYGKPAYQLAIERFRNYREQYGFWGTIKRLMARLSTKTDPN